MRKWTYLVAMLMLACATTTFTGCIDTDEPAGIEQLRGAKAVLLQAKAKVEEAKVKQVEAEAALKNAEAKAKEAEAQATLLKAQYEKAIAEQMAAAEIARIEAEIALLQAQIDTQIANAEAIRQSAAQAERLALIQLAQAQAELVQSQQKALQPYITAYEAAVTDYDKQYLAYTAALKAYNNALTNLETNTNAEIKAKYDLEVAVETAKANLAAAELEVEYYTAALEEAKALTPDELIVKRDAYQAEDKAYNDSLTLLQLELDKLLVNNPEVAKNNALKDSITAATKYTIAEYKNETAKGNGAVNTALGTLAGYDNGVFSYAKNENAALADANQDGEWDNSAEYEMVEAWLEALETAYADENKHINDSIDKTSNDKAIAVAKADSLHQLAVAAWEILVDARYGNLTTATAAIDTLKKYTDAYNATFAKLAPAVATYNEAIDTLKSVENTVAVAAYNATIAELEAKFYDKIYIEQGLDSLTAAQKTLWDAYVTNKIESKAKLDELLTAAGKAKTKKEADSLWGVWTKDKTKGDYYTNIEKPAADAKIAAISKDLADTKKGKINPALKAVTGAWAKVDSIGNTALAANWSKVANVYVDFEKTLNEDYGQVLSTKQTETSLKVDYTNPWKNVYADKVAPLTDTLKVYTSATDANVKFYYMAADGSDIDATEFGKMIASKLDETTVNAAWAKKSEAAWGAQYADRMLPVEEDVEDTKIGGTLKALMDAKKDLADYEAGMEIYETLATLIEEITAQKEALEAQVEEVAESVADLVAAQTAQQAVVDALDDEIVAKQNAIIAAQGIADELFTAYDTAINELVNNGNVLVDEATIEATIDAIELLLEAAEKADFYGMELNIRKAEEALANWDSVEQSAVVTAEVALSNAEYLLEKAQAKMERTEAALEAALEALKNTSAE